MDKIIKKYCPTCADYKDCPYRLRNLESKCSQLSDVAYGYELAEQDLALTWEDIPTLIKLCEQVKIEWWFRNKKGIGTQKHFEEVLRRFNAKRNEKEI